MPIQTDRLVLRHFTDDDLAAIHRIWTNPLTIWWGAFTSLEQSKALLAHAIAEQWFAVERNGSIIGDVYVQQSRHDSNALELGYHFLPTEWGCGYATEACRALLPLIPGQRLQAPIVPDNERSRRVATKIGMKIVRQVERGGLLHDLWEIARVESSKSIGQLIARIADLPRTRSSKGRSTLIIAIDGRGGSGKTTLSKLLTRELAGVTVVHLDDLAQPTTGEENDWGSGGRERLLEQVINPLNLNQPARYQRFDWKEKKLADWWCQITPGGIVIVEGVSTLHDLLYRHFDFKIWIDCSAQLGFERGLQRDRMQHGVDTAHHWLNEWIPEEDAYIEEHRPQERADYVLELLF